MNIRQTMLHLSGGLLLLLAPACTSEVDLEGGQPLDCLLYTSDAADEL